MSLSAPQAKYFAHWLTRSLPSDNLGKLTASLQDAQVDLTPHQIDAALFASIYDRLAADGTIKAGGYDKQTERLDSLISKMDAMRDYFLNY